MLQHLSSIAREVLLKNTIFNLRKCQYLLLHLNNLKKFVPEETNGFEVREQNILSDQGERDLNVIED